MTTFGERLRSWLRRDGLFRNIGFLAGGTALGQGIAVAASPILTRIYTPDDFGVWGVFTATVAITASVVGLRYEPAITLPESAREAEAVYRLTAVAAATIGGVLLVVGLGWGERVATWLGVAAFGRYAWVVPIGAVVVVLYQAGTFLAIRARRFGVLARAKVLQGAGGVGAQLAAGFAGVGPGGLLGGEIAGRALAAWWLRRGGERTVRPRWSELLSAARRYRKFPIWSVPSTLVNRTALQLPTLLLASFYGAEVVGWFMLVQRVAGVPMQLAGQAAGQVYLGELAELRRRGEGLERLYGRMAARLFLFGGLPILVAALVGSTLFGILFGHRWDRAGTYLAWLAPMLALQFVASPLSSTLVVLERQEWQFAWDVLRTVAVAAAMYLAHATLGGDVETVVAFSLGMSLAYLVLLGLCRWAIARWPGEAGDG